MREKSKKIVEYQKRAERALYAKFKKNSNILKPDVAAHYEAKARAELLQKYGYNKGKKILTNINAFNRRHQGSKLRAADVLHSVEDFKLTAKEALKASEKISLKQWYKPREKKVMENFVKGQFGRGWTIDKPRKMMELFEKYFPNEQALTNFYNQYGGANFNGTVDIILNDAIAAKLVH